MSTKAYIYLWIIIASGLIILSYYFLGVMPPTFQRSQFSAFIFFTILAFIGEIFEIELGTRRKTSVGDAIYCSAVFLGGSPLALPIGFMATFSAELVLRWGRLKRSGFSDYFYHVGFNTSQHLIAIFLASSVFDLIRGKEAFVYPLYNGSVPLSIGAFDIIATISAFMTFVMTNTILVCAISSLTSGRSFLSYVHLKLKYLHLQIASMGVLAILMAILWNMTSSHWTVLLAILPLTLIHFSLHNYSRLRESSAKVIEKMVEMLQKRDPYTGQHSRDVAGFAEDIAREMGLPEEQIETIRVAAVVHDIGKIAIPESIVNKQGPLTDDEWRLMKTHTIVGADLLSNLEMYGPQTVAIVRYEHEHWDGSGYPDGLKGELIPLGARIVAAADVYDALITDRPYRKAQGLPRAYTPVQAIKVIESMKEKVLDPKVADACIAVIGRRILTESQKSTWSSSGHPSSDS